MLRVWRSKEEINEMPGAFPIWLRGSNCNRTPKLSRMAALRKSPKFRAPNFDGMVFGCFTQNLRKALDLDGWGERKNGFLMFPACSVLPFEPTPPFQFVLFAPQCPPSGVIFGAEECEEVALGGRWGWFFSGTPPHMAWRRRIGLRNW